MTSGNFGAWVPLNEHGTRLRWVPFGSPGGPSPSRRAGYRLSVVERRKVFLQTGKWVDDWAGLKRLYRERGWRDLEKGEAGDRMRRDVQDHLHGAPAPEILDYGELPLSEKPLDMRAIYREIVRRD